MIILGNSILYLLKGNYNSWKVLCEFLAMQLARHEELLAQKKVLFAPPGLE